MVFVVVKVLLLFVVLEVEIVIDQLEICVNGFGVFYQGDWWYWVRVDCWFVCLEDVGFFKVDCFVGIVQVGYVIEIDVGDDGVICVDNVDCV